ncbi:MAG TPA: AraC family transcriptional regulator [Bryobacteraceae bacterium]|jgi:AraC-like DNA-binding protein|nr:AraC family transcriptional regulator [Bryobacteraceae bacterium]
MRNINDRAAATPDGTKQLQAELASKVARHIGSSEKLATAIPRLTLHRRTAPTARCPVTYEPSVILIPQGRKQVQIGGETLTYDSSRYLLTSVDLPAVASVVEASEQEPCLAVNLKLDVSIVREFLSQEEFQILDAPPNRPAMSTGSVTAEFLSAWIRLLDLLSNPGDIPFLSGLIEREIMYRILRGPEGARLRAIATLGDQSHRTAKAIAWIKANYARPLRVEELAQVAGMAVSTLHHHFRALSGMSPLQYQKQIRLQAARARMIADDVDAATAAFEVGYESASQFNREYSRLFGRPPLRDVRTLRSPGASRLELARPA